MGKRYAIALRQTAACEGQVPRTATNPLEPDADETGWPMDYT
jgi:hypothetical protein